MRRMAFEEFRGNTQPMHKTKSQQENRYAAQTHEEHIDRRIRRLHRQSACDTLRSTDSRN